MKLYLKYFSIHFRCAMQYKTSFFLTLAGQFLMSFTALLGMFFMFSRFNQVEGFSFNEVLLCLAVILLAHSLSECFAGGFNAFQPVISNGMFDRIMVRPGNEMLQVLASKVDFTRLGRFLESAAVLAYALPTSGVVWTPLKVLTLLLMIAGGTAVFSGLFIIYAALCFFTIESLEFMNVFIYGGREFGIYPLSIFGKQILRFFTFIVPLACVQYYPFLFLIGRTENVLNILAPFCGFLFLIPCYLFWRVGVRHYKSTGS